MHCIKHLIHFESDKSKVFDALSSINGLSRWWTSQTTGGENEGDHIDFRFGDRYFIQMKIIEVQPNEKVVWECTKGDPDWIGTVISFELSSNEEKVVLRFKHDKWPTHGDFFAHCNLSWAKYLLSLKLYLEKGKGSPFVP